MFLYVLDTSVECRVVSWCLMYSFFQLRIQTTIPLQKLRKPADTNTVHKIGIIHSEGHGSFLVYRNV